MADQYLIPIVNVEALSLVQFLCLSVTCGFFLCGIPICLKIRRKQSTEHTSPIPFLCCFVSSCFWLRYGIIKHDSTIMYVNGFGLITQSIYLLCYYTYCNNSRVFTRQLVISVGTIIGMFVFVRRNYPFDPTGVLDKLGKACVLVNIVNLGSPLAALGDVVRRKTTESLPFPLCSMNLINCSLWFIYGYLIHDSYVLFPNVIGIMFATVQLSLFVIYPSKSGSKADPLIKV